MVGQEADQDLVDMVWQGSQAKSLCKGLAELYQQRRGRDRVPHIGSEDGID